MAMRKSKKKLNRVRSVQAKERRVRFNTYVLFGFLVLIGVGGAIGLLMLAFGVEHYGYILAATCVGSLISSILLDLV